MTTAPRPQQAPPGLTVGGYTLLSRLGEGGMGVVHLARRPGGERVALKVLRPHIVGDQEARARLAREVSSLSRVRSRWVAEIVDSDPWAEIPYVATRYVPGLSLHDHVVEGGPVVGDDLTWFAGSLAEGLASVHAVGVLHRDVKPSNVLMEGRTPILIDFGLARVADDPKITHTGWLLGTPGYLAPEILYGDDASVASDVHSWAATVTYAATGRGPFGRGPTIAIMDRVRRGQHDLAGLADPLRRVVAAALDPDPERRPTLDQLLDWLRPQSTGVHGVVPPPPVGDQDPYTVPLALAAQTGGPASNPWQEAPTDRLPVDQEGLTRRFEDDQLDVPPEPPTPWPERARRGLLLASLALAAGAAVAAYPWLSTALLLVLTWLLRSGSQAASAAGDRRRLRGRRWYDGVQFLVAAPWHLVRSLPGTAMLGLWSAGLALAAALVCYAVAAGVAVSVFASGIVFAISLWLGPGGRRVRSPLARVVNPLSASGRSWILAVVVVLAVAAGCGFRVDVAGVGWAPADQAPWTGLSLPQNPFAP